MKLAIFPGSFDPITKGHQDIAIKASLLFDKLYVAIGENSEKNNMFSKEQRLSWIKTTFAAYNNIECVIYSGLTIDFCKKHKIKYIIRGLRSANDYENEKSIAYTNKLLYPDIETIFLLCNNSFAHISSSIVKEIIKHNGCVKNFIPEEITII